MYSLVVYSVPPSEIIFRYYRGCSGKRNTTKVMLSFLRHLIFTSGITVLMFSLASCHATGNLRLSTVSADYLRAERQRIHNATYNTKIDFYKKHFSGLLLFKAVNDTNNRVVFVTETGFKLFDFEFTPHSFNIQYCLPPLRKKLILDVFKNDLGQLIQTDTVSPVYINQKDSLITFTFARGNNKYEDYIVDSKSGQLTAIERGSKCVKQVSTKIVGINKGNFDEISIRHHALKLHIYLKQIER